MSEKIENILFPTDFSDAANNALLVAINMAEREQAVLHLLHVIVPECNHASFDRSPDIWNELEKQNKKGLKKLGRALEKLYKISVNTHTSISYIHAAECIEQLSEELSASLIVMGTHGLSGASAFFMGSNTFTVIKNVSCPVLAIPVEYKKFAFQNILLPVRWMAEVEDRFRIITHFFKSTYTRVEFLGVASFTDFTLFDCLTNKIDKLAVNLTNRNIEVIHRNAFCDNIADFVIEYADTADIELLVINPMIDDDWKNFTLGNHTQKILNHSKKPILCIKSTRNEGKNKSNNH